jgi:hypothetical protein
VSVEIALLQRIVRSPFAGPWFWADRPVLAIVVPPSPGASASAGLRLVLRDRGLFPDADAPVDATITCGAADLDAMAAGRPPRGPVTYALGHRPLAPRRKQAHALLALAAMGWCGAWPDPGAAPEHVALVRAALYDLGIGPTDGEARLFPAEGPLPHVGVRLTEGAAGTELVTVGLADRPLSGRPALPEIAALAPPRTDPRAAFPALRAAALYLAEAGSLPPTLHLGDHTLSSAPHPAFPAGLPLPTHHTWLLRVRLGPKG